MILTAATAFGLGIARIWWTALRQSRLRTNLERWDLVIRCGLWLVLAWTAAVLLLRLRRPRPSLRLVARQPGTVASLVVLATLGFNMASRLFLTLTVSRWPLPLWYYFVTVTMPSLFVVALLGCFLALAAGGRWRSPADWVDRLGRLLALAWVAAYAALAALGRPA